LPLMFKVNCMDAVPLAKRRGMCAPRGACHAALVSHE